MKHTEEYRKWLDSRVVEKRENLRFDSRQRSNIFLMLSSTIPNRLPEKFNARFSLIRINQRRVRNIFHRL